MPVLHVGFSSMWNVTTNPSFRRYCFFLRIAISTQRQTMGNESTCTLRFEGTSFSGKALLETSEILFRGDKRLNIPFSSIRKLQVKDGALHIHTMNGLAIFELGEKAEKWRHKISNPKSRIDKLGVKPGEHVLLLGKFPWDFLAELKERGAKVRSNNPKDSPWVFLAAETAKDLGQVKTIRKSLQAAAALWIVYPKGQKSITENDVRSAGLAAGLTDVKVTSFSTTHTALKFVIPKSKR